MRRRETDDNGKEIRYNDTSNRNGNKGGREAGYRNEEINKANNHSLFTHYLYNGRILYRDLSRIFWCKKPDF